MSNHVSWRLTVPQGEGYYRLACRLAIRLPRITQTPNHDGANPQGFTPD